MGGVVSKTSASEYQIYKGQEFAPTIFDASFTGYVAQIQGLPKASQGL